jgi:hypothetical protein
MCVEQYEQITYFKESFLLDLRVIMHEQLAAKFVKLFA